MSTKTTFKRVALVAVASLGFGVLTSVAPATAGTNTDITALTASASDPARIKTVGGATVITLSHIDTASALSNNRITAQITSAPATSVNAALAIEDYATATYTLGADSTKTDQDAAGGIASATIVPRVSKTSSAVYVTLNADVAGTYQILVTAAGASGGYAAGLKSVSYSITTAGAPTSLSVRSVGGVATTSGIGQLFALSMTDANGVATVLGKNEALTVAQADTKLTLRNAADSADVTSFSPESDVDGEYYVRAKGTTGLVAGSATLTFTGSGLLPATLTTNTSITKVATTAITGTVAIACTTAASCIANSATPDYYVKAAPALTISGLTSATTATIHSVDVQTALGDEYSSTITVAATAAAGTAGAATTTFTGPAPALGYPSELTIVASANTLDADFTYQAPVSTTVSVEGAASVLSATAGVNTFVAKVVDQYTSALANVAVSVTVSGRNTVAAKTLGVSDANGLITYSLTDAGTTGTKDTVTFSIASGTTLTAAATITYGTVTVDTVTVSGGSKAETIAGSTLTSIKAGDNGPEGSAVDIKAVVKDASGNLLAGVPVVFTVDAGAIVKTAAINYATVYTGADGSATTKVFGWISGKQTITATAGGKSSTDYLTWAANDATSARVLTATATGDIVSLKVVDRFGNAVQGVTINLSRTGAGLFGNGASTQNIDTDKNGTADVRFVGSGTVVAELAATYAQAYAAAGNITTKAATAATAGTTAGTGATLAPAGVAKVSVAIAEGSDPVAVSSQAAADAAAEATDAANAATDAANAAAEAADAATAAAQDAADAVAALSTQVSEMVDALKKQITALTNLVIKIQKKVKA
jgi:hypothetical protein